ncbi:lysine transporter LysM [Vibrio sp. S9_S30]|uniref:LysM-like peptidoglycan-binding domain-containing protein n=1 Tax=Vibrio sp. S9_S30 TaxID=2720226 RepID=UPI00168004F4|nr:LysM-like peptidoglycan-binding domain-containing protein [Vibrio sp. S9_S30]MBD1557314.1 lysine transporter LysM [Vibrio sp. S9_S30]
MNRRVARTRQPKLFDQLKSKFEDVDVHAIASKVKHCWARLPKLHQRGIVGLSVAVIILSIWPAPSEPVQDEREPESVRKPLAIKSTGLSEQLSSSGQQAPHTEAWKEYIVQSGDTLTQVFRSNELPIADLNALVKIEGIDKPLSKIREGQLIRFKLNDDGQLDILQLEQKSASVMFFRLSDGGFGRSK